MYEEWKVTVPAASKGSWTIEQFDIPKDNIHSFMYAMKGRGTGHGTFTRLLHKRRGIVMSDTEAEVMDHLEASREARNRGGRVLINGLGLGMFASHCLSQDNIKHVDIVEIDKDIIAMVEPHLRETFPNKSFDVHNKDAYAQMKKWKAGTRWDIAWHDIWDTICGDDREDQTRLMRSYGRRVGWQACWGRTYMEAFNIR